MIKQENEEGKTCSRHGRNN